jgi:hypothetical protein
MTFEVRIFAVRNAVLMAATAAADQLSITPIVPGRLEQAQAGEVV